MVTRHDARYLYEHGDSRAVLLAWWYDQSMGAWADDDYDAFRAAVEDELRHIWDNPEEDIDLSLISIEGVDRE